MRDGTVDEPAVVVDPPAVAAAPAEEPAAEAPEVTEEPAAGEPQPAAEATEPGAEVAEAPPPTRKPVPVSSGKESSTGVIAKLQVTFFPMAPSAGQAIMVRILATDAQGDAVSNDALEFMATDGKFGTLNAGELGVYTTSYTLSKKAEDSAKMTVASSNGDVSQFVKVPVTAAVASTKPAKPPREGKPKASSDVDVPWLRVGVGPQLSSYSYLQSPTTSNGPLMPQPLQVGGTGQPNGTAVGVALTADGWLEDLPYVGFHVAGSSQRYGITVPQFNGQVAWDWLVNVEVDAKGRYYFDSDGMRFHVGANAGIRYNDFLTFQGSLENNTVTYETLGVPALGLGGEIGAEIGKAHVNAGITESLAYFSLPYGTAVNFSAGYAVTDELYVQAGMNSLTRSLDVIGRNSGNVLGNLSDGQLGFRLSAGYAF